MTHHISRRKFIKSSATAAFGLTFLPSLLKAAPSERVRIAHIGLGGMGNQHMQWFAALPDVEIVALCDVDSDHLNKTAQALKTIHADNQAKLYEDFWHVLDR